MSSNFKWVRLCGCSIGPNSRLAPRLQSQNRTHLNLENRSRPVSATLMKFWREEFARGFPLEFRGPAKSDSSYFDGDFAGNKLRYGSNLKLGNKGKFTYAVGNLGRGKLWDGSSAWGLSRGSLSCGPAALWFESNHTKGNVARGPAIKRM